MMRSSIQCNIIRVFPSTIMIITTLRCVTAWDISDFEYPAVSY